MKKFTSIIAAAAIAAGTVGTLSAAAETNLWYETFEDSTWTANFAQKWKESFDNAGSGFYKNLVTDPSGEAGNTALEYGNTTNTASWIRNKTTIVPANSTGIYEVSADIYVPGDCFLNDSENVTLLINNNADHRCELRASSETLKNAFQTKSYPRDEWFKVVFRFDFDSKKYDEYIEKDGSVYSTLFTQREMVIGDKDLTTEGIATLRVAIGQPNQHIYIDNIGAVVPPTPTFGLYNFADGWGADFDFGGSATRNVVDDPVSGTGKVLEYAHTGSQSASWMRNKLTLGGQTSGKWDVGADLYIPSEALTGSNANISLKINEEYAHNQELGATAANAFRTADFPRDKWIRVRFALDLDKGTYDTEVLVDGKLYSKHFTNRGAKTLKEGGLNTLRLYFGGSEQKIYVKNLGICEYVEAGEPDPVYEISDVVTAAAEETAEDGTVTKAYEFNGIDPGKYNSLVIKTDDTYKGIALSRLGVPELSGSVVFDLGVIVTGLEKNASVSAALSDMVIE